MTNKINLSDLSKNEEDYLKALFNLTIEEGENKAGTNQLAVHMGISPASVNGMIKKLRAKKLVTSEKYSKLKLTLHGKTLATKLIRKHRLWETFLYEHLNFSWDEVHEVAEQLEHIKSPKLIEQLDRFLGFPESDPHGDIIPKADGSFTPGVKMSLADVEAGKSCQVVSVKDNSVAFLQMVSKVGIGIKTMVNVLSHEDFDGSVLLNIDGDEVSVSRKFAENVFVKQA